MTGLTVHVFNFITHRSHDARDLAPDIPTLDDVSITEPQLKRKWVHNASDVLELEIPRERRRRRERVRGKYFEGLGAERKWKIRT
jgi:hypothetical protein